MKPTHFQLSDEVEELPSLDSSQGSTAASVADDIQLDRGALSNDYERLDIWTFPDIVKKSESNNLLSWDTLTNVEERGRQPAYLSEAGKKGFDISLRVRSVNVGRSLPEVEVSQNVLLAGLFELGLGRDSALFKYVEEDQDFVVNLEQFMLSGYSVEIVEEVIQEVKEHGLLMKSLKSFFETNVRCQGSLRTELAFRSAVEAALFALEQLMSSQRNNCKTLTQLVQIFPDSHRLLVELNTLMTLLKDQHVDDLVVSHILDHLERNTGQGAWTEQILQEIACRTASPWVSKILQSCGIQFEDHFGAGNALILDSSELADQGDNAASRPNIRGALSPECGESLTDCISSLELLRDSQPDHPFLYVRCPGQAFTLESSWEFIERVQTKCTLLEQQLRSSLDSHKHPTSTGRREDQYRSDEKDSSTAMPQVLEDLNSQDMLGTAIGATTTNEMNTLSILFVPNHDAKQVDLLLQPPLRTSIEMSIWPLLNVQNRFIQQACLRLLFYEHKLRVHVFLQHQYQLLGNGDFSSRLSHALFDPTLSSGERNSARSRTTYETGLRLETRQSWPPATSELRLALMGILTEAFRTSNLAKTSHVKGSAATSDEIPGDLSFSIRDLSDEELELCRNAHNIEALDFLCISYRPNKALQSIMTEKSLQKYDRIFKHVLRLLRVQQVTQSLVRQARNRDDRIEGVYPRKLCIEMHQLITGLYDYTMNVGIGGPWRSFELYLQDVEGSLRDVDANIGTSVKAIRQLHERALDSILSSLYLNKKYQQVSTLIEDILRLVLKVSATIRTLYEDPDAMERSIRQHTQDFRKQAFRLCSFLKSQSLSSQAVSSKRSTDGNEVMLMEQLLLRLDFNGYFSRGTRAGDDTHIPVYV